MDFSFALKQLKKGKKIGRSGWSAKGQFITLGVNCSYLDTSTKTIVNANHETMGNSVIVFHGVLGEQVGWLATQSDMLSDDWEVID